MDLTLKVWRQKNAKAQGHFETYKVKNISADSVLLYFHQQSAGNRAVFPGWGECDR